MNTPKTIFAVLAAVLLTGPASGQTKIGLIDLQKVFDGYYKTKAADALIQDQKADFLKQKKTLLEGYEKAGNDYKKALDDSNKSATTASKISIGLTTFGTLAAVLVGLFVCLVGLFGLTQIRGLRTSEAVTSSLVLAAAVALGWR